MSARRKRCGGSDRSMLRVAAAAMAALIPPARRAAAASTWADGTGSWSVGTNWTGGVPVNGSDVNIVNSNLIIRTINYDTNGAGITLHSLTIDNTGSGSDAISQAANLLSVGNTAVEFIGFSGNAQYLQSGGTNSAAAGLTLGLGGLARACTSRTTAVAARERSEPTT